MGKKKKKTTEQVKITLDFDSHFEGVMYMAGEEYELDKKTAKALLQINNFLVKENK